MSKVFVVYVSPLEMGSTEDKLVDLPMEQEALSALLLKMGQDRPLYVEVSDYCGRDFLMEHLPEDMDLTELNLLAGKLAALDPIREATFEGLVRKDRQNSASAGSSTWPTVRTAATLPRASGMTGSWTASTWTTTSPFFHPACRRRCMKSWTMPPSAVRPEWKRAVSSPPGAMWSSTVTWM